MDTKEKVMGEFSNEFMILCNELIECKADSYNDKERNEMVEKCRGIVEKYSELIYETGKRNGRSELLGTVIKRLKATYEDLQDDFVIDSVLDESRKTESDKPAENFDIKGV